MNLISETKDLVLMSANKGIQIVCAHPSYLMMKAEDMDLDIPEPLSYRDYYDHIRENRGYAEKVYIDELPAFLAYIGMNCDAATGVAEQKESEAKLSSEARDSLLIYLGKFRGIMSVVEFDDDDEDSSFVRSKLDDILNDMELTLKTVDEVPRL